jgi:hypothetical protein
MSSRPNNPITVAVAAAPGDMRVHVKGGVDPLGAPDRDRRANHLAGIGHRLVRVELIVRFAELARLAATTVSLFALTVAAA